MANVRLNMVKLMPAMKRVLKYADDDILLAKLEEVAHRIRTSENDRDVAEAIEDALEEMAKIAVILGPEKKKVCCNEYPFCS